MSCANCRRSSKRATWTRRTPQTALRRWRQSCVSRKPSSPPHNRWLREILLKLQPKSVSWTSVWIHSPRRISAKCQRNSRRPPKGPAADSRNYRRPSMPPEEHSSGETEPRPKPVLSASLENWTPLSNSWPTSSSAVKRARRSAT